MMTELVPTSLGKFLPNRADATNDDPSIDIRGGLLVVGAFTGLLIAWAALAPLDAGASASGQIIVSGHDQVVEHREGGVVAAVEVVDGQPVKAGQVLMELAPEDVGAEVRALRAQSISLQAQRARLMAETEGSATVEWPTSLSGLAGEDLAMAQEAVKSQQAQFDSGLAALKDEQAINARKAAGISQQIGGSEGQLASVERQQVLLDQQLQGVRNLAAKGYASLNSVRTLERSAADLSGARAQHAANIADFHQQMVQAQLQSHGLENQRRLTAATALRETEDQLNEVAPKLAAARAQLERGTLRAQVDGVVSGLAVFTPGAVVAPGEKLMEVVPTHRSLVVDARLPAAQIEGVRTGRKAEVRLLSLDTRQTPVLTGIVTQVSADSFVDERTGQAYYTIQATVPQDQLLRMKGVQGADSGVRPGVPVEVVIPLQKRNAFDYLFGPLSEALWKSFRQR
jgi:HlyD family secretion protein